MPIAAKLTPKCRSSWRRLLRELLGFKPMRFLTPPSTGSPPAPQPDVNKSLSPRGRARPAPVKVRITQESDAAVAGRIPAATLRGHPRPLANLAPTLKHRLAR